MSNETPCYEDLVIRPPQEKRTSGRARRVAGAAALAALAAWTWLAHADPGDPVSPRGEEEPLSSGSARAQLSFNFAKSIAVDGEGSPHVVWFEEKDGASRVYYRRRTPTGWGDTVCLSGNRPGVHPTIAVEGRRVVAAWHVDGTLEPWIALRRSEDRGFTWEPEQRLSPKGMKAAHPSLAAAAGRLHITFVEGLPRSAAQVRYARSLDGGKTWEPARVLSEDSDTAWVPTVTSSGDGVYAAWVGTGVGNEEEYFRASTDGGQSWGAVRRMTRNRANSWAPSLAAQGKVVHMVWFDQQDNPKMPLEVEGMLDEVLRLVGLEPGPKPPEGVLVPDPEAGARLRTHLKAQRIVAEAPGWAERGGDARTLGKCMDRLGELGKNGTPYSEKEHVIDECLRIAAIDFEPKVRAEEERVYYQDAMGPRIRETMRRVQEAGPAWVRGGGDPRKIESFFRRFEKTMDAAIHEWELYYRRSDDGGATWGPELRLTRAPGLSHRPSVAAVGNAVHVAWFDGRDGETQIYYKASLDGGRSWTSDLRLTQAKGASSLPSLAADRDGAHLVWVDGRGGAPAIYYRRETVAAKRSITRLSAPHAGPREQRQRYP